MNDKDDGDDKMILIVGRNCQKCKMLKMRLEAAGIDIEKEIIPVYAEDNMDMCREWKIQSIPALIWKGKVDFDDNSIYNILVENYKTQGK